MTLVLA
jgi:hypothetical protein